MLHQRPAVPLALVCTGHPEAVEVQIVVPLYRDPGGLQRGVLDKDLFLDIQFPEDVPLRQAVHQPSAFSLHAGVGLFAADDAAQVLIGDVFRRQIDESRFHTDALFPPETPAFFSYRTRPGERTQLSCRFAKGAASGRFILMIRCRRIPLLGIEERSISVL